MADPVSRRGKRKTTQFRVILVWIIIFYFKSIFLNNMHFITNGYKCFSKTNSTDQRQCVPLIRWEKIPQKWLKTITTYLWKWIRVPFVTYIEKITSAPQTLWKILSYHGIECIKTPITLSQILSTRIIKIIINYI